MGSRYADEDGARDERAPVMTESDEQHPVNVASVPAAGGSDSNNGINNQHGQYHDDSNHPDAPLGIPLEIGDDSDPPTPRFIEDEGSWKRWRWVPFWMRRLSKSTAKWVRGPAHPQPYRIKPIFPKVQEFPLKLIDRLIPRFKHRVWLVTGSLTLWIILFAMVKWQGTRATDIAGWGEPKIIRCGVAYWAAGNRCGIDGSQCRPFNGSGFPFRCAANCEATHVLEPRAVGDQEVVYQPFVIGGSSGNGSEPVYRGDSFICGAAIHAGVISNENGGCGVVELVGRRESYPSTNSNGIKSVGFDSYFPLSFRFAQGIDCSATDMRWPLLAISAVFTALLALFTRSPAIFFFPSFTGIFFTIGLSLDPPPFNSIPGLLSNLLGKFLPSMFIAWVMYDKMGVRRTLKGLTAQVEKSILWLGPCWVGALDNYTLSFIPISRLNAHDLQQQPGAQAALAIIIILLSCIFASQVWFFRQEGRLIKYLKLYALLIGSIVVSIFLPGLNLRIHHYILALLLLPGTSLQTRPCLVYQGLLVGLFINGASRWGFDSVLQTSAELAGDAQKGSHLPVIPNPTITLANSTSNISTIAFKWEEPPIPVYDGISILVNDVERFRSYFSDEDSKDEFVWDREEGLESPEYFRFAFIEGSSSGDYTKAGTWTADGEWNKMKAGPSSFESRRSVDEEALVKR